MKKVFFIFLFVFSSAQAKEGFSTDLNSLPAPVAKAWNSVFLVYGLIPDKPGQAITGTAFLVNKVAKENNKVELVFLTAAHVFLDEKICTDTGPCAPLGLYRGYQVIPKIGLKTIGDEKTLEFESISIDEIGLNADVAILIAETSSDVAEDLFSIPVAPSECSKPADDYVIGYPGTDLRPVTDPVKAADYNFQKKRWSEGHTYGYINSRMGLDGQPMDLIVSTADILQGNSGSPLLNVQGEVVGVVVKGPQIRQLENGQQVQDYVGNDDHAHLEFQAGASSCTYFSAFARRSENFK